MSFTRTISDPCEYQTRLADSNSVLTYNLDPNRFYNCNECRIKQGIVGGNNVSLSGCNLVDVESELRNQTRINSNCPQYKYLPTCRGKHCGRLTGLPCGGQGCLASDQNMTHLQTCDLVHYQPRIQTVGYKLDFPTCATQNPASVSYQPKNA